MAVSKSKSTSSGAALDDPKLFLNRELSWLEFNRRVLAQAADPAAPLLERLRFLTICSTNLDEFFEIRVAGVKQRIALELAQSSSDGLSPTQLLDQIRILARTLVDEQYRLLNEIVLPRLHDQGITLLRRTSWSQAQNDWAKDYFENEVAPVLTPMGLDPAHPFPQFINKSLNFAVSLDGVDAFGRDTNVAVVHVPRCLPRVISPPPDLNGSSTSFVLLSSIIHANISGVFPGMTVEGCYQFRVTRNSDLWVDEEEVEDLLKALKGELFSRHYGAAVRLEVADNCSREMAEFLRLKFNLDPADVFRVNGPVNLHRIVAMYELADRPELKYKPFIPSTAAGINKRASMFELIRRNDMLLHHPFESFSPVTQLLREAADDPDVLAIKITLYRIGTKSPLSDALFDAARADKEVTVVVELRARFDEAANIGLATRLQAAGANVVYGIVGYKTHAKMMLIVRREGKKLRRYVHLGTGNYHTGTAKAYTDIGLLTSNKRMAEDVHRVFMQLTGLGKVTRIKKLLQAPFTLVDRLLELIEFEAEQSRHGKKGRILARMNSLSENKVIKALYKASQDGVEVDLIVRGICCLRPGIPGLSENIRVRSIVGRFLEHSRVYHFFHNGDELTYGSSADWMNRNLFRRVETCFPIEDPTLKKRVVEETLRLYLKDNLQAWELESDGSYRRLVPKGKAKPVSAQLTLLGQLSESV